MARGVDVAVRVDGLRDLRRRLKAVDRAAPKELNRAAKAAGQKISDRAAERAPRRTGALARSIRMGSRGDRITVRSPLPYAAPIHWGWPARSIRPSLFLVRAAEEMRAEYVADLEDAIEDVIHLYDLDPPGADF